MSGARARKAPGFTRDPLWYKDAVVYQLHVKSFFDANDDGIGDFAGLIAKLDYIAALGVNTIWLLPFYPSPRRDDGYDVSDYRGVHPDYGSMADVRRFIAEAHRRGLRVITELVINHTSDQHPWFQRARRARPGSALRDFYVWSDDPSRYAGTRIIFVDTEPSNWTWDPVAKAYYWHRFYAHQPDLNFDNPRVIRAVIAVMRFWLEMGVDGLRLDAVPYLIEREGTSNENLPETHVVLKQLRRAMDVSYPGRMLLAEANQWPEDVQHYFGGDPADKSAGGGDERGLGDECHMAFHFPLMPRMYMAVAQEDRFPITDILRQTPDIPSNCQWAIFLRNHDELTLEMVTEHERDYLWTTYAADRRARLNIGIRRRLAPLLERDRRRIELLNSLLLSMPGTPVIYYGDEIGMGDNIYLGDRDGVRTPMQWSPDRNGGFSKADPARLVLPPIMDPLYGYQANNVEAQQRDAHSLLKWMQRMLAIRNSFKAFGRGTLKLLYPANRRVIAYLRQYEGEAGEEPTHPILCVANLSGAAQAVELDLSVFAGRVPVEMIGRSAFPPIGQLPYLLTLPPHGFLWFELAQTSRMPAWYTPPPEPLPDHQTFVTRRGLQELLHDGPRQRLEREVLPAYLPRRRWYAGKTANLREVRIEHALPLPETSREMLLLALRVETDAVEHYLLPLGLLDESDVISALPQQLALARVRTGARVSLLIDAVCIDALARTLLRLLQQRAQLQGGYGQLCFEATSRLDALHLPEDAEVRRMPVEQSNTSLVVGDKAIVKLFRRLKPGVHPEAEMGRMLTQLGFRHAPALLGEFVLHDAQGGRRVLGIAQEFLHNQGDAWSWVQAVLQRAQRQAQSPDGTLDHDLRPRDELLDFAARIGMRLGEMHALLATAGHDPAFAVTPMDDAACAEMAARVRRTLDHAFAHVERLCAQAGTDEAYPSAARLLGWRAALERQVEALARRARGGIQMRIHGDLHLGQILVVQGDAVFVDFEGEPNQPLDVRRAPSTPLRDVAGMLRSFDYALEFAARAQPVSGDAPPLPMSDLRQRLEARFLEGYRASTARMPYPLDAPEESAVLGLALLERCAHEITYEAENRPAWLDVALRGALRVAESLLESAR